MRPDTTHWLLQYFLGAIIGAGSGFFSWTRLDGGSAGMLSWIAGSALLLAGLASLFGDDIWRFLVGSMSWAESWTSSDPYNRLEHSWLTRVISWLSIAASPAAFFLL